MAAPLHERLHFDTAHGQVLDAGRRYLLLRSDVLMGLFDRLPDAARAEALRAFGRSVAELGSDSVQAYAATAGAGALPAMMEGAAASLGWGRWHLRQTTSGSAPRSLTLEVENSPFAAASTRAAAPACHAIAGMLEALAGALWNEPANARETWCAAEHGGARCEFSAVAQATLAAAPAHRPSPSSP